MSRYELVEKAVLEICLKQYNQNKKISGVSTIELSKYLNMSRPNVSRELSKLVTEEKVVKTVTRPVIYYVDEKQILQLKENNNLDNIKKDKILIDYIIGKNRSLKNQTMLAKAAIVYPPHGLHTLIIGETGVGKSYFAKCMHKYAVQINKISNNKKFVVFNCADYASNPQLLISHIFGVKKGAYTGAEEDRAGIIENARNGIMFLDEIHRLPPEGQEMLFTLIDEGKYTPLGSTKEININVMIICATTENINSTLLKTFRRRIPVIISLPPLRERSSEERLDFIKQFLKIEMQRVNKKIEINNDALTALLNYECPNNIGQLKSDIQIACAKAFLRSMFSNNEINVRLDDFTDEVKSGLLISKKIKPIDLTINENYSSTNSYDDEDDKYSISNNIYEFIEKKTKHLKNKGIEQEEIKNRLNKEVRNYINKYLENLKKYNEKEEIKNIVNNELYTLLRGFIPIAEYKLERKISKNTFIGLLIHIDTFLARIKENKLIENPKIDEIRMKYPQEFKVAMSLSDKLQEKYKINVPIGEIGFMAMFFAAESEKPRKKVGIVIAMHGNSTATSIADVANHLLNVEHAVSFDMPLSMKPKDALCQLEEIVKNTDEGEGVLLLVDMGSLKFFGDIITQNTGVKVKTVDMITTATVIEATRKAIMGTELNKIIKCVNCESKYLGQFPESSVKNKKKVIVTACSTGEGTASKIKDVLYTKYTKDKYKIINLSIKERDKFNKVIDNIKKENDIEFIVSAFDPKIEDIKYISMDKFFREFMGSNVQDIVNDNLVDTLKRVYSDYLNIKDYEYVLNNLLEIINNITNNFGVYMDDEKLNGILMHIGCIIEKLKNKEQTKNCDNLSIIKVRHNDIFEFLKDNLNIIENKIDVSFSEDDIGNIVEILIEL